MAIKLQRIRIIQVLAVVVFLGTLSIPLQAAENPQRTRRAGAVIDQPIFNSQGKELGELEDLVIKRSGSVKKALISVGGVLEMGEKLVSARYKSLTFTDQKIILDTTKKNSTTNLNSTTASAVFLQATTIGFYRMASCPDPMDLTGTRCHRESAGVGVMRATGYRAADL